MTKTKHRNPRLKLSVGQRAELEALRDDKGLSDLILLRINVLLLTDDGHSREQSAWQTELSRNTIDAIIKRWHSKGIASVLRRKASCGALDPNIARRAGEGRDAGHSLEDLQVYLDLSESSLRRALQYDDQWLIRISAPDELDAYRYYTRHWTRLWKMQEGKGMNIAKQAERTEKAAIP